MATAAADARTGPERVARAVLAVSAVCLLAGGLYGIDSPFLYGHYGYHGGEFATRARHTLRHGSLLPANVPRFGPPRPEDYYLHHPILTHQLVTATLLVLGDHEYAVRAAGLLSCLACFVLLTRLVRAHWGAGPAALAGATFVLVPIDVWFANHIDPGFPSIAALLAFFLFYLPWLATARWRDGALALGFAALAGGFEWSPYLAAAAVFLHAVRTGLKRRGRFAAFAALYAGAVAAPLIAHALVVWRTGHLPEMLESYGVRTAGGLDRAFYLRSAQTALAMLGGPLLFACGLWGVLLGARILSGHARARDLVGISFAFAWLAYIHVFRSGALVHPYRYLYAGVVCALAVADLAAAALSMAASAPARRANAVALAVVALGVLGPTLPLAWRALRESRRVGGVPFSTRYDPGTRKIAFAELVRAQSRPDDVLYVHPTFADRHWGLMYYLDRDAVAAPALAALAGLSDVERAHALALCVPDALSSEDRTALAGLARAHPVWGVSPFLLVDLRRDGLAVFAADAAAPARSPLRRYFEGPHPRLDLVPDVGAAMALRRTLGLPGTADATAAVSAR